MKKMMNNDLSGGFMRLEKTMQDSGEKLGKTRWSRFKDLVVKNPETTAYAATFAASTTAFAASPSIPLAGLSIFSMFSTCYAYIRENVFKKAFSKSERVVTSVIADVGFIGGCALYLTKNFSLTSAVCFGSLFASLLYKPVKDIILDKTASVMDKIKLLSSGSLFGLGMITFSIGASSPGVDGFLKLNLRDWQHIVADFSAIFVGIMISTLGYLAFSKSLENVDEKKKTQSSS